MTQPVADHGLCGDIKYEFLVDDATVGVIEEPVGFNPDGPREVVIRTDDINETGEKTYTVIATLVDYPEDDGNPDTNPPQTEADGTITFISPCATDATIAEEIQNATVPAFDFFSGDAIVHTFVPFTVTPGYCPITITCESVTLQDGTAQTDITCADLTCDAVGNC